MQSKTYNFAPRKGKIAFTLSEASKGQYPQPVYNAVFASGATKRMSFWSKTGKPLDWDRGRKVCQLCRPDDPIVYGTVAAKADPAFLSQPAPKAKRVTAAQLRKALAAVLGSFETDGNPEIAFNDARALLAA